MKKIAIYDIDYTILSTNSHLDFTFFLIRKNPFKIIYLFYFTLVAFVWFFRIISTEKFKSIWLLLIKNLPIEKIESLSFEFVQKKLISKIKPEAIENINNFKKNGYCVIFASASYEFYIKYLADYLKADFYFGTNIKFKDNKVTPHLNGKNCKGKEKINRILKCIPAEQIDIESSVGYSDSMTDIYFLEIVNTLYLVKKKKWAFEDIIKK
jgi:HAD superfamily hydrolase (TIGR01490 family)